MLKEILARFEEQGAASVMARVALERAIEPAWVDEVFEAHRRRQYPRELLFSTVVELVSLVSLGLRPSLHAAARKAENLPVSLAALYDKINRTEPAVLGALVRGSAQRLAGVVEALEPTMSLDGWRLRVLDGNHLPASDKRLGALRGLRGAALPGHTLVVYDPDTTLVTDIVACCGCVRQRALGGRAAGGLRQGGRVVGRRPQLLHAGPHARLARRRCQLRRARACQAPTAAA